MQRQVVPFFQPNYQQKGFKIGGQQSLTNFYFHPIPGTVDNRAKYAALPTPGTAYVADTGGTLVRAGITFNSTKSYFVVDNEIKKLTTDFEIIDLGITLAGSTGSCSIAATGDEVVVCCNDNLYLIDTTADTVTNITSVLTNIDALNIPIKVLSQNSRFIYLTSNSNQVHISNLYDANTIQSLNGYSPNTIAGTLSSGAITTTYQYYFNENSVEIYQDTGAAIGPFSRAPGGAVPVGIAAPDSALSLLDRVYYLGRTSSGLYGLVEIDGVNHRVVSSPDFVQTVDDYLDYENAIAWSDTHNGHVFYNLTFPTTEAMYGYFEKASTTWTYDLTTGLMFKRNSYVTAIGAQGRAKANCCVYLNGKQLIGAWDDGKIYEISQDYYDENSTAIQREIISGTLLSLDARFSIYNLEIDVEKGVSLESGTGSNPTIMLQVSKDRGHTWTAPRTRQIGLIGEYNNNVIYTSFGIAKSFTWKLTVSDPVRWAFLGVTAEIEGTRT